MRTLVNDNVTVKVRGRRAVVLIEGRYVGTLAKGRGRWSVPGSTAAYPTPTDAADALAYRDAA
jgi:hypothetical protein